VNNDGYDDWLINAPSDDLYRYGKIYLYFGSDNPDEICDLYFQGQNYENLSFDYPLLGDINGDEYDDLAFLGIDFPNSSWVKIHYGSQEMDTIPDLIFYGENTSTWYGYPPCTGIGDINNDGHNDWLLRYGYDYGVYFGSLHPDTLTDMIITPEVPCHWINEIFAYGDIDGDNIDDIVVGGRDSINNSSGYVLGYLGGEEFDVNYDYIYESPVEYEYLSSRIGLADINGDDILEVLASGAGDNYGRVWFFSTQEWNFVDNEILAHPNDAVLFDNHPNPFNPSTTIRFDLPETRKISLLVYDVMGREVAKLIDGINIAGFHEVVFDGKDLASGIYFAQLSAGEFSHTKKMVLMK